MFEPVNLLKLAGAGVVTIAAIYDLKARRIPNWLILIGIATGIILQGLFGGWSGLGEGLLGFLTGAGIYLPLFALRAMGAGDAKLVMALGLFLGPAGVFKLFIWTSLIGGVIGLWSVLVTGRALVTAWNLVVIASCLMRLRAPYRDHEHLDVSSGKGFGLPHGVFIALAYWLLLVVQLSGGSRHWLFSW